MALSKGRRLSLYNAGADSKEPVSFSPADALYVYPNPDNTRKNCRNCVLWLFKQDRCFIHAADIVVSGDMVCGYHVFGKPMSEPPMRENVDAVDPTFSGLIVVPDGTSCDTCEYYEAQGRTEGTCTALVEPDTEEHPITSALGCCTKWSMI